MTDDGGVAVPGVGKGAVAPRLIFISHTHADRELALGLGHLIDTVYIGIVEPYISSDPGPSRGIMPGVEWYAQIATKLREAESVWVLATKASITRPWIYWEAGTGRAFCPNGIAVLSVGIAPGEVPSPLSNFQVFDGGVEGGAGSLIGKVASQLGVRVPDALMKSALTEWLALTTSYQPKEPEAGEPTITPERLDRLDAAIARLEAAAPPARQRTAALADTERLRRESNARRAALLGRPVFGIFTTLSELEGAINGAPISTAFAPARVDGDGDLRIDMQNEAGQAASIWLKAPALPLLKDFKGSSERSRDVLARCQEKFEEESASV